MTVLSLDHVNIRTADVGATATFLAVVLGLEARPAPGAPSMDHGCWMHDARGHPIIHIGPVDAAYPSDPQMPFTPASGGGAVHHVALECDDIDGMTERLDRAGIAAVRADYPAAGLRQLFVREHNGIMLELNFRVPAQSDSPSA